MRKNLRLCLRIGGFVSLCVLLGCLAFGGPSVDDGDFLLEGSIDETMALERVEALELRRYNKGVERLTTAACDNCQVNFRGSTP